MMPQKRGEDAGERQAEPEAEPEILRDQREGIGADRVEGDVAEVEQAGEPDHDVQPPAEHHVGEDQDGEVDVVAAVVGEELQQQEGQEERDQRGRATPSALPTTLTALGGAAGALRRRSRPGSGS